MIFKVFSFLSLVTSTVTGQTCPSLIWSDEFDGTSLDETKWSHQLGDGCDIGLCGWGNNELQQYQAANTEVSNGLLKITADREVFAGGQLKYTSSRINSLGKQSFQYGLFEARIKIPTSQGIWPAFWMLGDDISTVGWPACGELDIMENIGREPKTVHGTMHFGPQWPNNQYTGDSSSLTGIEKFTDNFHVFSMEKFEDQIRMYVDGVVYMTRTPEDIAPEAWPFNNQFHFLLNIAIGGLWPGNPDATSIFPQKMEVDYIRIYDGVFGDLAGPKLVSVQESGVVYQVVDGLLSYQYTWSVPAGATITSGQGTSTISVSFGSSTGSGLITVSATSNECGPGADRTFVMPISIAAREFAFLSSQDDGTDQATVLSSTGTLDQLSVNPAPNDPVNNAPTVLQYERNGSEQYDVLILSTGAIDNPSDYAAGGSKFFKMNLYTTAPAGTSIILQLENSARSTFAYPSGRHSRYDVTVDGPGWQRLTFDFMNLPDPLETVVDQIVILFDPNSSSNDTYYFDNLDSYSTSAPAGVQPSPNPSSIPTTSMQPTAAPNSSQGSPVPSSSSSKAPSLVPTRSSVPSASPSETPSKSPSPKPSSLAPSFSFLSGSNDSSPDLATFSLSTGLWYDGSFPNPVPSDQVNSSPTVIGYQRNDNHQYDVIFYSTNSIPEPADYSTGARFFTMDIYIPSAIQGTPYVLLQLENSARNGASYPVGRHSRYDAVLDSSFTTGWQQVRFNFVDFPDPSETAADTIVLLFAPDTFSSDYYYFDNLMSQTDTPPTPFPTIAPTFSPSMFPTAAPQLPSSTADLVLASAGDNPDNEAALVFATGVWKKLANPLPTDPINSSPFVLEYNRNGSHLYDVIFYITDLITVPSEYTTGSKYFTMDVYVPNANAATPSTILLQLENSARTDGGYPVGRHSRYEAILNGSAGWQQVQFQFIDTPDSAETIVDKLVLLFAPNTFSDDTFYYDNLTLKSSSAP